MKLNSMHLNVDPNTLQLAQECTEQLEDAWKHIDELVFSNQIKVLRAFSDSRISLTHMWPSTGYGYQDTGREGLESLFAQVFGGESALVRLAWTSGTHVLKTALFGLLRPGDELLSVTGTPYETLQPVIGIGPQCEPARQTDCQLQQVQPGSLKDFGIEYRETSCLIDFEAGAIDEDMLRQELERSITSSTRLVLIQRSRGYSHRKTISIASLGTFMELVRNKWPHIITFVDNCYCEFTDVLEPPALGVSITAGSLIKNPGGGLTATGGYVVGQEKYVDLVAGSLYAPGLGKEAGSNPYGYRDAYQGLFLAPKVVGEALKGASFAALFFGKLGYQVDPGPFEQRGDIVQEIILEHPEKLKSFSRAIQEASPIDSFATPEPWDMPGYAHQVIMAAGTFVQGASIELSCDGPFTHPYTAYLQGGLTKEHVIYACLRAKDALASIGEKHNSKQVNAKTYRAQ